MEGSMLLISIFTLFSAGETGFDHGAGHSLPLLYDAKASHSQNTKEFNGLDHGPSSVSMRLFKIIIKYSIFITV